MGVGNGLAASGMPFFFCMVQQNGRPAQQHGTMMVGYGLLFTSTAAGLAAMGNESEEFYRRLKNCPRDAMQR